MKPATKLVLVTFALVLTLGSVPAMALPGACELRCFYPNTCYDACVTEDNQYTTCFDYFGGSCDPW
jgi:hypothetical protein